MVKYVDKFNVVEWMAERGITGYLHRIDTRKRLREAIIADKLLKPTVQADLLEKIEQEIAEIEREAQDRYNDWASDPLENGSGRVESDANPRARLISRQSDLEIPYRGSGRERSGLSFSCVRIVSVSCGKSCRTHSAPAATPLKALIDA